MFPDPEGLKLNAAIHRAAQELETHDVDSKEYGVILERLGELYEMKRKNKRPSVSPDTLATIAANLIGIAVIIRHEQFNNITTKALTFAMRTRS